MRETHCCDSRWQQSASSRILQSLKCRLRREEASEGALIGQLMHQISDDSIEFSCSFIHQINRVPQKVGK